MRELALFAGAGGGILGGHLLGWRTVCAVEWADYPRRVLLARQRDGILPRFPIWDDVQTFDGNPWRGRVDVVSGGFPCQDISAAGKGAGIDGARSGMWFHMARIVREVRPRFVFVENSPVLTSRGLGRVLGDLAAMGYDAEWGVLGADDCGAPHKRERIWIVGVLANSIIAQADGQRGFGKLRRDPMERREQAALCKNGKASSDCAFGQDQILDANSQRREGQFLLALADQSRRSGWGRDAQLADANMPRLEKRDRSAGAAGSRASAIVGDWWAAEPAVGRVAHRVADRVDRLKAIGNGQVSLVAATAFRLLTERAGWAA
ncbi:MAG TPA: DNA cytosine methyltransferase [Fibrobacteria bacterium]|nr:DNA cytosine methyltransferase [Fibrobacteria bacterium]